MLTGLRARCSLCDWAVAALQSILAPVAGVRTDHPGLLLRSSQCGRLHARRVFSERGGWSRRRRRHRPRPRRSGVRGERLQRCLGERRMAVHARQLPGGRRWRRLLQAHASSVYRDFVNDNGSEIEQDLKFRIAPVTGSVRFLPVGHGSVEPYVGIGVGIFNWRWSETGEFVDTSDGSIFRAHLRREGHIGWTGDPRGHPAPIADVWDVGGEVQWQKATGDIDQHRDRTSRRQDRSRRMARAVRRCTFGFR